MLAAGAAQRNGEVTAIDAAILGDPAIQESQDVCVHLHEGRLAVEKVDNGRIEAVQASQFGIPVWIRQTTQVENEICVGGYAVFESE